MVLYYVNSILQAHNIIYKNINVISIGQEPSDQVVDGMMSEAPGPLNFTMFLTLFGEKLTGRLYYYYCSYWGLYSFAHEPSIRFVFIL